MSATGNLGMDQTVKGEAGSPGVVATSNKEEGNEAPGAAALGAEKPKATGTKPKRKLPVPTSIVEENKKNLQQQRRQKPANLNIPKEKNSKELNIEERFHQAIKANNEKWKAAKRIDEKRIVALTKMVKSQNNRLRLLETAHKKVMEGNLTEIMEINRQIYGGEFKKTTNKAENELRKTEESAKAAQDELGIWADKPELFWMNWKRLEVH